MHGSPPSKENDWFTYIKRWEAVGSAIGQIVAGLPLSQTGKISQDIFISEYLRTKDEALSQSNSSFFLDFQVLCFEKSFVLSPCLAL